MRYAINIYDVPHLNGFSKEMVLFGPIISEETVRVNHRRVDGDAFLAKASVSPERWQAVKTLIRDVWGYRKSQLRLYESKTGRGGWKQV
jgi:hypothetical protein